MTIAATTRDYIESSLTRLFGSQTRKDKTTPAVTHSIAVGQMLTLLDCSPLTVAGGYGHDIIEDIILDTLGCDPQTANEIDMHRAYAEAREMLYGYTMGWTPVHDMPTLCTIIDACTYQPEHYIAQRANRSDYDGKLARKILAGRIWTNGINENSLAHNGLIYTQPKTEVIEIVNRAVREIKLVDAMHNETTSAIDPAFHSCFMRTTMPIATSLAARIRSDGTDGGHSPRMISFAKSVIERFSEKYPAIIEPTAESAKTGELIIPDFLKLAPDEKPNYAITHSEKHLSSS